MEISIFPDKEKKPSDEDVKNALGVTYAWWKSIHSYVLEKYPAALDEWNCPGKKYGWSYQVKDKKRTIVYLLPRDGFFKVAFVFGNKATGQILASDISNEIKTELANARVYAEGRGIRIDVKDASRLGDIEKLIEIKLSN
jgi:cytoplasmic iron level regulating protein YaaA (DUF328/UPF0246 family)